LIHISFSEQLPGYRYNIERLIPSSVRETDMTGVHTVCGESFWFYGHIWQVLSSAHVALSRAALNWALQRNYLCKYNMMHIPSRRKYRKGETQGKNAEGDQSTIWLEKGRAWEEERLQRSLKVWMWEQSQKEVREKSASRG
jgi:hypothetical protein